MITRMAKDEYHLAADKIDMTLSQSDLLDRLRATQYWSEDQLSGLTEMDIGDRTPEIRAYYVVDGVRYSSSNGVMGKPA